MFLKSSFSVSQTSGFVAFDGGGTTEADLRREPAEAPAVVTPRLEPELLRVAAPAVEVAQGWREAPTWQPSTSALVRRVETVVIVAICAYFATGLAGVAGWF